MGSGEWRCDKISEEDNEGNRQRVVYKPGTQIHADLVTLMRDVGTGDLKLLDDGLNCSIYRAWMHSWQAYCTDSNHREAKDCTCKLPADSDEENTSDNEADSEVDMN